MSVQAGLDVLQMDVGADAVRDVFQAMGFVMQCSDTSTTRSSSRYALRRSGRAFVMSGISFPVSVICSAVFAVGLF